MIGAAAFLFFAQNFGFGKLHSRAEFAKAMLTIKKDWTDQQVLKVLGEPDRIDVDELNETESWCYGTNGPNSMATLGSLVLEDGKVKYDVEYPYDTDTPSPQIVSEAVLRKCLNALWRPDNYVDQLDDHIEDVTDPLWIIKATNTLQPLGTEGAKAVIKEYCRVGPLWRSQGEWLFWLERVLFVPKKSDYVFRLPALGWYEHPEDLTKWPTFPMLIIDDVPINGYMGASLKGAAEIYSASRLNNNLEVRPNLLRPPDDPFTVHKEAITKEGIVDGQAECEILRLARTVYRLGTGEYYVRHGSNPEKFEAYHQEFLRLGGHWDSTKNMYVRRDGTFNSDHIFDIKQHGYKFTKTFGVKSRMVYLRKTASKWGLYVLTRDEYYKKVPSAVAILKNLTANRIELILPANLGQDLTPERTLESYLALEPHVGRDMEHFISKDIKAATGQRYQVELHIGNEVLYSPEFEP